MPKRNWDHLSEGVIENSRHKIQANVRRNARSVCQACALQIPTFFCDWDCDGSGNGSQCEDVSRISDEELSLPQAAQAVGPEIPQQEYAELFTSPASTITDTSTDTTRSSESYLASPSPNVFNWPTDIYDSSSPALASGLEQPDDGESPTASCLDFPWQESSQFRYPATENRTTSTTLPDGSTIQPHCSEHWLQQNGKYGVEAYDMYGVFDEPATSKGDNQEILQVGSIAQRLAQLDRRLQEYAKQQLRITEYYIVQHHCRELTKGEFLFKWDGIVVMQ